MQTLSIKQSDYNWDANFTITDSTGTAYNLTGYTITFKMWREGDKGNLVVNGTGSIVVAASGTCKYTSVAADFAVAGDYLAEIELTKSGTIESSETFMVSVEESG